MKDPVQESNKLSSEAKKNRKLTQNYHQSTSEIHLRFNFQNQQLNCKYATTSDKKNKAVGREISA